MKRINPDNSFEESFIATQKEIEEMELPFFDNNCDLCCEHSDKWFVFKRAGSGSMDSWICSDCIKKINDMLEKLK